MAEGSVEGKVRILAEDATKEAFGKIGEHIKHLTNEANVAARSTHSAVNALGLMGTTVTRVFAGAAAGLAAIATPALGAELVREFEGKLKTIRVMGRELKNLGLDSRISIESLQESAGRIQRDLGIADQSILRTQQALLKARPQSQKSMDEMTQMAADLAVALGTDVPTAANMFAKATYRGMFAIRLLHEAMVPVTPLEEAMVAQWDKFGQTGRIAAFLQEKLAKNIKGLAMEAHLAQTETDRFSTGLSETGDQLGELLKPTYDAGLRHINDVIWKGVDALEVLNKEGIEGIRKSLRRGLAGPHGLFGHNFERSLLFAIEGFDKLKKILPDMDFSRPIESFEKFDRTFTAEIAKILGLPDTEKLMMLPDSIAQAWGPGFDKMIAEFNNADREFTSAVYELLGDPGVTKFKEFPLSMLFDWHVLAKGAKDDIALMTDAIKTYFTWWEKLLGTQGLNKGGRSATEQSQDLAKKVFPDLFPEIPIGGQPPPAFQMGPPEHDPKDLLAPKNIQGALEGAIKVSPITMRPVQEFSGRTAEANVELTKFTDTLQRFNDKQGIGTSPIDLEGGGEGIGAARRNFMEQRAREGGMYRYRPSSQPGRRRGLGGPSEEGPMLTTPPPGGPGIGAGMGAPGPGFTPGAGLSSSQSGAPSNPQAERQAAAGPGDLNWEAAKRGISGIESGGPEGNYSARGPNTGRGRALGRYQVMDYNVGPWTEKYLGKRLTPDEFLASKEAQDKVFEGEFGKYAAKYGPEGAAQAWLGGEGSVGKLDRTDTLGTSVGSYGSRFMSSYNREIRRQRQQASAEPKPNEQGTSTDRAQPIPQPQAMREDPLEVARREQQNVQLGRGRVDVNLKLDKNLQASRPSTQQPDNFDVGVAVDRTGTFFARPGDPTYAGAGVI